MRFQKLPKSKVVTLSTATSVYPNPSIYGGWAYTIDTGEDESEAPYMSGFLDMEFGKVTQDEIGLLPIIYGLEHLSTLYSDKDKYKLSVIIETNSTSAINLLKNNHTCINIRLRKYQMIFPVIEQRFRSIEITRCITPFTDVLAESGRVSNPNLPNRFFENPRSFLTNGSMKKRRVVE